MNSASTPSTRVDVWIQSYLPMGGFVLGLRASSIQRTKLRSDPHDGRTGWSLRKDGRTSWTGALVEIERTESGTVYSFGTQWSRLTHL